MTVYETEAFLLRSVPFGEADVIATFLTRLHGKIGAVARSARKSKKRFSGLLEPLSTVMVRVDDKGRELSTLVDGRILVPRTNIMTSLDALEAAGKALRWVRALCPVRTPEPEVFADLGAILNALNENKPPRHELCRFAYSLLASVGYGLELSRCVRCGKPRPEGRSAYIDPEKGGIVCSSCGGGRYVLTAGLADAAEQLSRGEDPKLGAAEMETLLKLAEDAILAHAGVET